MGGKHIPIFILIHITPSLQHALEGKIFGFFVQRKLRKRGKIKQDQDIWETSALAVAGRELFRGTLELKNKFQNEALMCNSCFQFFLFRISSRGGS